MRNATDAEGVFAKGFDTGPDDPIESDAAAAGDGYPAPNASATILIVDDVAHNRDILVTLLRHHGHRMLEAADGREGLAAARSEHPDLVITDVLMPVMDGYEFVKQLRVDPTTRGIPVVFYTAHYDEGEATALALSTGVTDILTKPVRSADVLEIVGRVLSREPATNQAQGPAPPTPEFDRDHLRLVSDKLSEKVGDLRTSNARLRALISIGVDLASEGDTDRRLQNVCSSARELVGATYATIGIIDRNRRSLDRLISCEPDTADWIAAGDSVPGILGRTVAEGRTFRGNNPGGDPARVGLPSAHPKIQEFLTAPIASGAHVFGWICLVDNNGRPFTDDDEHLITVLAGQVGRIYELEYQVRERKQGEKEFRALFAANPLPMWIYDLTTLRFLEVNDAAVQRYGYERDEFLAMTIKDIRPPEDVAELLTQLGQPREAWRDSGSSRHRLKSGEAIDVDITSHTIAFAGQSAAVVVAQDITERKRAEETIRASIKEAADLRYAIDAHALVATTDPRGKITFVNDKFCEVSGYHREELIGQDHRIINSGHHPEEFIRDLWMTIKRGDTWHGEFKNKAKSGTFYWVDTTIVPFLNDDGTPRQYMAIRAVITKRKEAEMAVRTAEERMRFALEAAGVGIWDTDYRTGSNPLVGDQRGPVRPRARDVRRHLRRLRRAHPPRRS